MELTQRDGTMPVSALLDPASGASHRWLDELLIVERFRGASDDLLVECALRDARGESLAPTSVLLRMGKLKLPDVAQIRLCRSRRGALGLMLHDYLRRMRWRLDLTDSDETRLRDRIFDRSVAVAAAERGELVHADGGFSQTDVSDRLWRSENVPRVGRVGTEWSLRLRISLACAMRAGANWAEFGREHGLSVPSVKCFSNKLAIPVRSDRVWSDDHLAIVLAGYAARKTIEEIADDIRKTGFPVRAETVRVHASRYRKERRQGLAWRSIVRAPAEEDGIVLAYVERLGYGVGGTTLARLFSAPVVVRLIESGTLTTAHPGFLFPRDRVGTFRKAGYLDPDDLDTIDAAIGRWLLHGELPVNTLAMRLNKWPRWLKQRAFENGVDRCPDTGEWLGPPAWTDTETEGLKEMVSAGVIVERMAAVLDRMPADVREAMVRLGLKETVSTYESRPEVGGPLPSLVVRPPIDWSQETVSGVEKAVACGEEDVTIAARLGLTKSAFVQERLAHAIIRRADSRTIRSWTPEEDARLFAGCLSFEYADRLKRRLAFELDRPIRTVGARFSTLGITFSSGRTKIRRGPWSVAEDELARVAARQPLARAQARTLLARRLSRSLKDVDRKFRQLGLRFASAHRPWTREEDELLAEIGAKAESRSDAVAEVARLTGRTPGAVSVRFGSAGIRFESRMSKGRVLRRWSETENEALREAIWEARSFEDAVSNGARATGRTMLSVTARLYATGVKKSRWKNERRSLGRAATPSPGEVANAAPPAPADGPAEPVPETTLRGMKRQGGSEAVAGPSEKLPWTDSEIDLLRQGAAAARNRQLLVAEAARAFHRPAREIRAKLNELGFKGRGRWPVWSRQETDLALDIAARAKSRAEAVRMGSAATGRTESAVAHLFGRRKLGFPTSPAVQLPPSGAAETAAPPVNAPRRASGIGAVKHFWTAKEDRVLSACARREGSRDAAIAAGMRETGRTASGTSVRLYTLGFDRAYWQKRARRKKVPGRAAARKTKRSRWPALTKAQIRTIVARHRQGWAVPRIARSVGCATWTVYEKLRRAGRGRDALAKARGKKRGSRR